MNAAEIRELVREALREELARPRPQRAAADPAPARSEAVSIRSDRELMAFVQRVLEIAADPPARRALTDGRIRFRLAGDGAARAQAAADAGAAAALGAKLVRESDIDALDEGVSRIEVASSVRFTPLALDRLRQRGITIKRIRS